jgi:hypothetical protein
MRCFLTATVALSAFALSVGLGPAAAFSPIDKTVDPEGVLYEVQLGERGTDAGRGKGNSPSRDGIRSGNRGRDGGPRAELRSRDRDGHRHRHHGRRGVDFDIYVGPGYGYVSECEWLRQRARATGSSYWWRRYRACLN